MTKVLRVAGHAYLMLACLFIIANYAVIIWYKGFWTLAKVLSPFNVTSWMVAFLAMLPGLLLLGWAARRQRRGEMTARKIRPMSRPLAAAGRDHGTRVRPSAA